MLRYKESMRVAIENPVMAFPIKKRINTELFIDRKATLYILTGGNENEGQREGG